MQILNFSISSNKIDMQVDLINATSVTSLRLWKNFNYKDYNLAIDLSSKLDGLATQNITITLSDLGETQFDGVYYLEAESDTETSIKLTGDLTRFKECILEKTIQSNLGKPCLIENNIEVINAHMVLVNLAYAIELQFIDEILSLLKTLNIYCSTDCKSCGTYKNIKDYNYRIYNDSTFVIDSNNIV